MKFWTCVIFCTLDIRYAGRLIKTRPKKWIAGGLGQHLCWCSSVVKPELKLVESGSVQIIRVYKISALSGYVFSVFEKYSHATKLVFIIDLITNAEKLLYYHYERSTLTELGTRSPSFSPLWRRNVWQWSSFLTMARSSSSVLLWKKCNLAGIHWNRRRDQQLFGLIVVLWNTTGFYLRPCNKLHLYPHKWDIRNITGSY